MSAELTGRRRPGGCRFVMEAALESRTRNWLLLSESSGQSSCLQAHPACSASLSGQLPSQLSRDGESTASLCCLFQSHYPLYLEVLAFKEREHQETEGRQVEQNKLRAKDPSRKKSCRRWGTASTFHTSFPHLNVGSWLPGIWGWREVEPATLGHCPPGSPEWRSGIAFCSGKAGCI